VPGGAVGNFKDMPAELQPAWQELNLRWFQFGAFAPLFRSHGQNPYREVFNLADEGTLVYDSLVAHVKLRYRLMPYIYTLAADAHYKHATMMRGLVMDFPHDPQARAVTTQYLFGPSLLVNPVYEEGARSRSVYLPAGTSWIDFHTGARHAGGQAIEADAPLSRLPLFVRAGAIIATGPDIQHTGEGLNAPLVLNVYTGADGSFELYEDDGVSYAFETGGWSRIPLSYDEAAGTLTIGGRVGSFEGMATNREISVRWIDGQGDTNAPVAQTVTYTGEALSLRRP
jgi:alpha-D-xyloside xylohydrolase